MALVKTLIFHTEDIAKVIRQSTSLLHQNAPPRLLIILGSRELIIRTYAAGQLQGRGPHPSGLSSIVQLLTHNFMYGEMATTSDRAAQAVVTVRSVAKWSLERSEG